MTFLLSRPTRYAQISNGNSWIAATPDGHMLYLKNDQSFSKFFHFQNLISKIIFSPSANTVYVIDSHFTVWKRSLTQRSLKNEIDNFVFSEIITIPFSLPFNSFITIVPYEKSLYLVIDSHVYMIIDNNIHSNFNIETEITTLKPVPTDLAKLYNLVDENCNFPFVILCGTKDGTLSTLTFPNKLDIHQDISKPFISKSEPITQILISRQTLILAGKYGTVNSISIRGQISGSIPFPVEAISISDPNLFFVSRGHLYSSPLLNPSSFSIVASFPARIVASCSGFCITTSGALVPFEERSPITISPRSELIEFSLSRLREISEENEKILEQISDVEANLSDSQIIKSINNGNKALEGGITLIPSISPDGRSNLICQVKLAPIGSYSCRGLSLSLIITTATGFQDIYCLPNIQTINVNWELPISITTTTAITIDLVASCGNQASVVLENIYDIIDLSAEIDLQKVILGSTFSSLTRNTVQNNFRIGGTIPRELLSPMARQSPTGEKWTLRVDGQNVTVVAGSKSTAMAVRAAVERRAEAKGTFSIDAADESIENLRDQADTILSSTNDDVLPIGGGVKSRVELLHENATKIADEKLMPDI